MSRRIETGYLVTPSRPFAVEGGAAAAPALAPSSAGDDYVGRLLKYIPAEIVGFYLAAAGLISPSPGAPYYNGLWLVFGLGFILVPIYFWITTSRQGKPALWSQIILATIAYPIWVFAIGGPFTYFGWYRSSIASVLLVFATVVFGLYKPPAGS